MAGEAGTLMWAIGDAVEPERPGGELIVCRLSGLAARGIIEGVMGTLYQHTQRGTLLLVVLIVGAIVVGSAAYLNPEPSQVVGLVIGFVMLIVAWLFSSLTVIVSDDELQWYFGPGAWEYRLARADIAAVSTVRNSVLNGFGIRMRPGFRLYNVSGLDAVELRLKSGEIRRIGTDDPQGLAAALQS
jgi:hypothetical protein